MRREVNALLVAAGIGLAPGLALAGDVMVEQVGTATSTVACAVCNYQVVPINQADAPPVYFQPGAPNSSDILQTGNDNVAIGVVVGRDNYVGQFQLGNHNQSYVGLVAEEASIAVIQHGNNLDSRLTVWGNPGGPITVYQPPGSAPVNAAIYTAADGTQVILPGNATTIIRR